MSTAMTRDSESAFTAAMISIYKDAKALADYNASRFLSMVNENGGVSTARTLLHATRVSEGYTALWERGHLELTVEAQILQPRWRDLFSDEERDIARKRLAQYGFTGNVGTE
jgi:hypothetical protein